MDKRKRIKSRLIFILFVLIAVFAALGGRVFYLKTVHGAEYETAAKQQQVSRYDSIISPNRGSIVDRNNQPLAISTRVYNIILDVRVLADYSAEEQEKTVNVLSEVLGLDANTLKGYLVKDPATGKPALDTNWKVLAKKQEPEIKEKLESMDIKGVVFENDTKRKYPAGSLAAQVIGFTGTTNYGLEKMYDEEMSGIPGRSFITYDGTQGAIQQEVPATDGNTIVTTLDYNIQSFAEEAVRLGMEEYNPENAAAIVMNPQTGEILAMASGLKFDPNDPMAVPEGYDEAQWDALSSEEQNTVLANVWKNFCISSTYEPGSIFKSCVAAAAIEEGIIENSDTYYCGGKKNVAGTDIKCHLRTGHGTLDIEGIIANSCNVGIMDIGDEMGASLFYKYQKNFGIGEKTGVDLPDEVDASNLMYSEDQIRSTELATMSFGQSFNTNTLQILNAVASVINGGNLMRPYIVSQIVDPDGNVVKETKPEVVRKVLSQETSDIMRKDMVATIEYGTGKKAKIEGYTYGGKTGTAQQAPRSEGKYTVSFIGFIPVENPQYIAITLIHKPEYYADGVTTVAPMMKSLMENIIKYANIEPSYEVEGKQSAENEKVVVADYTGSALFDALADLDAKGLTYEVVGTGTNVVNQMPHGGTEVDSGTQVLVYVEEGENEASLLEVTVPDVKGKKLEEAQSALEGAGLTVTYTGESTGIVQKTEPSYGTKVTSGTQVTLTMIKDESSNNASDDESSNNQDKSEGAASSSSSENENNST